MGKNARLKRERRAEGLTTLPEAESHLRQEQRELINDSWSWAHGALICVMTFVFSIFLIESEDIFSNIVTGEYLWKNWSVPKLDPFSFTGPYPWLLNRPLPSLVFYGVHSLGGLPAIQIFCGCILSLTYALFYEIWARRTGQRFLAFVLTSLLVMASCYWFQTRIYVFAYLYVVTALFLVTSANPRRVMWMLPLQVLWINSHPSAILGVFFTGVWWLDLTFKHRRFDRFSSLILFGVFAANVFSPMGVKGYAKFIEELFSPHPSRANIFEWFSPFSATVSGQHLAWWYYGACIAMALWAAFAFVRFGSLGVSRVLFVITLALFAMSTGCARHIPLFYFAYAGALMMSASRWVRESSVSWTKGVQISALVVVLLVMIKVCALGYANGQTRRTFAFGIDSRKFPEKAIEIIKNAKIEGNVFSDYDTGSYFLYRMFPDYKVYIDGARLDEVYGEDGFMHYMRLGNDLQVLKGDIEKYDIRAFIIPLPPTESEIVVPHRFLSSDPQWKLAYFDDVNMLYVRQDEAQKRSIPTYAFLNPFASVEAVMKKNPDASAGFERDFKQGDVVNPESIAFLILKQGYFSIRGWKDKSSEVIETMRRLCARKNASPACAQVSRRYGAS
jgi:hypothetical protein